MWKSKPNKIAQLLILIIGIFLIIYYFVFPLIITSIWTATIKEVKNVKIEGFVCDQNTKPLDNYVLQITNYYYSRDLKKDVYVDESFNGGETSIVRTDKKGFYTVDFKRSCFIQIDNMSNKYLNDTLIIKKHIYKQKNKIDIHLKTE